MRTPGPALTRAPDVPAQVVHAIPAVGDAPAIVPESQGFGLKKLSEQHKMVASLVAQGLKRGEVAALVGFTPEYITMLVKEPIFRQYMQGLLDYAQAQLEASFDKVVDTVNEVLVQGTNEDRLKAARLHSELTGRIGKGDRPQTGTEDTISRLERLADRLKVLVPQRSNSPEVIDVTPQPVPHGQQ